MRLKRLSNKELRAISNELSAYELSFKKGEEVYFADFEDTNVIIFNKKIKFFYFNNKIIPSLVALLENPNIIEHMKKVVVDLGALNSIINGADVMRPGIIEYDENINKDDIVVIVEEKNKKPIAIGKVLYSSEEIKNLGSGKTIKNIHCLGDNFCRFTL